MEVSILKGGNINLYIPITIGTIPQGCQSSLQSNPVSITTRIAGIFIFL